MTRFARQGVTVLVVAMLAGAPAAGVVCSLMCTYAAVAHEAQAAAAEHDADHVHHLPSSDLAAGASSTHDCGLYQGARADGLALVPGRADTGASQLSAVICRGPAAPEPRMPLLGGPPRNPPIPSHVRSAAPLVLRI